MSTTTSTYKCFIGGEWADAASGETMDVINPATGQVIAEVPRCGAEDVDRAVAAAKKALPRPGSTSRRRSARSSCSSSRPCSTTTSRSSRSSSR